MGVTASKNFKLKNFGNDSDGEELYSLSAKDAEGKWHYIGVTITTSGLKELADLIKSELVPDNDQAA